MGDIMVNGTLTGCSGIASTTLWFNNYDCRCTREEGGLDGWEGETPLWYYVLKEAEVRSGGQHLGPVGGRIVAEVLLGLLDADPGSYRSADPGWHPTVPSAEPGRFTMADLLVFATEPSS